MKKDKNILEEQFIGNPMDGFRKDHIEHEMELLESELSNDPHSYDGFSSIVENDIKEGKTKPVRRYLQ